MAPGAPRSAAGVACTICSPLVDARRVLSCACVPCCDAHRDAILAPSSTSAVAAGVRNTCWFRATPRERKA